MANYDCEVRDASGEIIKTKLEAPNMQELSNRLSDRGYVLVKAKEIKSGHGFNFFSGRVSRKELMVFTVQLATLVGSAVTLIEAISVLADQTQNPYFKSVLDSVSKDLQSGIAFSKAIRKHPRVFDKIYCNMCEAGEAGGILDEVLDRLAAFSEADAEVRGKIKTAMTMPIVQLTMSAFGVIFLLVRIFPNFADMFSKMQVDLPPITQFMMFASDSLIENSTTVILSTLAIVVCIIFFLRTEFGSRLFSHFKLKCPILGDLTQKIAVSRFARTFCSLLGAGVPILESLKITGSVMGNPLFEEVVDNMAVGVQRGGTIASSLTKVTVFPPMVKKMIEVGESSGNLTTMLSKAADFYDREVKEALDSLTSALTPILTVAMGFIIGTIALSVFMPLFRMTRSMR